MTRITVVGAGSVQFGTAILGEIFLSSSLRQATICLHDINAKALNNLKQKATSFIAKHDLKVTLEYTTDPESAFRNTDFVIIAIEVGNRFKLWEQDWYVARQYGINQVYGENGGPGGLFHALRIIPPILNICEQVRRLSPDALVLNFSNPMSRICTTVHRKFPDLRFIGLCHEIANVLRDLPALLEVDPSGIAFTAGGLNHFSCVLEAHYLPSGKDAYSDILKKAPAYYESLPGSSDFLAYAQSTGKILETEGYLEMQNSLNKSANDFTERRTTRFFLERFKLLPITSDSHFAEYLAWGHAVADNQGILDFYRYYKEYLCATPAGIRLEMKERAIPIIEGIVEGSSFREDAVNIPNKGYIAELPGDIVVEVPANFEKGICSGQQLPKLPTAFAGLLRSQVGVLELTAEAVINQSKNAAIQALLVDPVVNDVRHLDEYVETMLSWQSAYLGYLK